MVANYLPHTLVVYDAQTFKVYNKITCSEGTSH